MIINIGNIQCQTVIGGKDNLLPFNIYEKLREYLRVRTDGYQYTEAYKRRGWDGYRYFISAKGAFATGFLPQILRYLDELGVPEVTIVDERHNLPVFKSDFVEYLGGGISLREEQAALVPNAEHSITFRGQVIPFPRGVFDCATNSGKDYMMCGIMNNVESPRAIMLIHNTDVYNKAVKFFIKIYGEKNVGQINSKHYRLGMITVAMHKSLLNKMKASINVKKDMKVFNLMFVDESHRVAGEYGDTITQIDAGGRYFMSGTPFDNNDAVKKVISVGLSGPILGKITNQEMIDLGRSLKPVIHILLNKPDVKPIYFNYRDEKAGRVEFAKERVRALADFLYEYRDKYICVAFNEKKHGHFLFDTISEDYRFDGLTKDIVYGGKNIVYGGDNAREQKLLDFEEGRIRMLFTSTIIQEGLNLPLMNVLAYTKGGMDKTAIKQFVGRLIREDGIHRECVFIDFYDVGRWVEKHSRKRIRVYKEEGFDLVYHYPNRAGYYNGL